MTASRTLTWISSTGSRGARVQSAARCRARAAAATSCSSRASTGNTGWPARSRSAAGRWCRSSSSRAGSPPGRRRARGDAGGGADRAGGTARSVAWRVEPVPRAARRRAGAARGGARDHVHAAVSGVPVSGAFAEGSGGPAAPVSGRGTARLDRAMVLANGGAPPRIVRAGGGRAQVVDAVLCAELCVVGRAAQAARDARGAGVRQPGAARAAAARRGVLALDAAQLGRLSGDERQRGARPRPAEAGSEAPARCASVLRSVRRRALDQGERARAPGARGRGRGGTVLRLRAPLQGTRRAALGVAQGARAARGEAGGGGRVLRGRRAVSRAGRGRGRRAARARARPLSSGR